MTYKASCLLPLPGSLKGRGYNPQALKDRKGGLVPGTAKQQSRRAQTIGGAVEGLGTSATAPSEALARPSWGYRVPGGRPPPPPHHPRPRAAHSSGWLSFRHPLRVRLSVFLLLPAPKPRPHSFRRPLPSPERVSARRAAAMLMRAAAGGAGRHSQRQSLYIQSQWGRFC